MVILLGLLASQCTSSSDQDFPAITFHVNDSLLATNTQKVGSLILRIPQNWQIPDSASLKEFAAVLSMDSSAFLKQTLETIASASDGSALLIFGLPYSVDRLKNLLGDPFNSQLEIIFETDAINRSQFSVNEIPVIQYLITGKKFVALKLFLMLPDQCQELDFFIPINRYSTQIRTIESTVGSITKLKQEGL